MRFYEKNSSLAPGFKLTTLRLASSCQCTSFQSITWPLLASSTLGGQNHFCHQQHYSMPVRLVRRVGVKLASFTVLSYQDYLQPTVCEARLGTVQSDPSSINFKIFSTRTHNSLVGRTILAHSHQKK